MNILSRYIFFVNEIDNRHAHKESEWNPIDDYEIHVAELKTKN